MTQRMTEMRECNFRIGFKIPTYIQEWILKSTLSDKPVTQSVNTNKYLTKKIYYTIISKFNGHSNGIITFSLIHSTIACKFDILFSCAVLVIHLLVLAIWRHSYEIRRISMEKMIIILFLKHWQEVFVSFWLLLTIHLKWEIYMW